MGSLRDRLGYNKDKITIWEETEGELDQYHRPTKVWKKTVVQGTWENSIKTIRSMTGECPCSFAPGHKKKYSYRTGRSRRRETKYNSKKNNNYGGSSKNKKTSNRVDLLCLI